MGSGMGVKKGKNHYFGGLLIGASVWFSGTHLSWRKFYTSASSFSWRLERTVYSPSSEFTAGTGRALPINVFNFFYLIDLTPAPPLFNQLWKVCYTIVDRGAGGKDDSNDKMPTNAEKGRFDHDEH